MGNKNAMLALAAGFGGGYLRGKQSNDEKERRDRLDAQNTELHNARMEEINAGRQQRISLADAAAPAQVDAGTRVTDDAGSDAFTKDPDAAAMMGDMAAAKGAQPTLDSATRVNKEVFTDPKKAKKAEAEYNSVDATTRRQIKALQTTDPAKALTLANAAIETKQRLQKEADDAAFRLINGFKTPDDMATFMTEYSDDGMDGKFKAKVLRSADGNTWSFVGTGPDGKEIQLPGQYTNDEDGMMKARMALAGRFADPERRLKFYQWDQEMGRKKGANAETARHNSVMEGAATKRADAAMKAAGASGGGNLNREERIRYTTLFNDAGRRLGESKKTLATLQKSALFMTQARTEGSPQAQQMQELQDSIKGYEEERALYQGLLAGSQAPQGKGGGGAPAAPKPAADGGQPAQPTTQADYDALPKGARYMRDGKVYIKN